MTDATPHEQAELLGRCFDFLAIVKNKTPGAELETWLNANYPPGNDVYDNFARLIKSGVADGWAANVEVAGKNYRRSRILTPREDSFFFSITSVYMNSPDLLRGDYHGHPYGEINLIAPLDEGAKFSGPRGWQGAGWTAPDPGSSHYPEVRGGAAIALFFLPAGRITYDVVPDPAES